MPGLQSLFESGRCAVVANVGPLIEPVTKEQYQQRTARLPPQLFSHNTSRTNGTRWAAPIVENGLGRSHRGPARLSKHPVSNSR